MLFEQGFYSTDTSSCATMSSKPDSSSKGGGGGPKKSDDPTDTLKQLPKASGSSLRGQSQHSDRSESQGSGRSHSPDSNNSSRRDKVGLLKSAARDTKISRQAQGGDTGKEPPAERDTRRSKSAHQPTKTSGSRSGSVTSSEGVRSDSNGRGRRTKRRHLKASIGNVDPLQLTALSGDLSNLPDIGSLQTATLPGRGMSKVKGKPKPKVKVKNGKPQLPGTWPWSFPKQDPEGCILDMLPQELREHVFSHMLHYEMVQYDPSKPPQKPYGKEALHSIDYHNQAGPSCAHAYRFDLALFRVNRNTGRAAQAYFDRENKLVLVYHSVPWFKERIHEADIPIITDDSELRKGDPRLERFTKYDVRMEIHWSMRTMTHREDETLVFGEEITPDVGSFLMLLSDFDKLCFIIRHDCQLVLNPGVYVVNGNDEPFQLYTSTKNDTPTIIIDINRPDNFNEKRRESLFKQLRTITGGGHQLTITSRDPHDHNKTPEFVADLKKDMAPPLIWIHSWVLNQLETMHEVRRRVYKHFNPKNAKDSKDSRAFLVQHDSMHMHAMEWRPAVCNRLLRPDDGPGIDGYGASTWIVIGRMSLCNFVTSAEHINLLLTNDHWYESPETPVFRARNFLRRSIAMMGASAFAPWSTQFYLWYWHLDILVFMAERPTSLINDVRANLQLGLDKIEEYQVFCPWVTHDLPIIKAVLDDNNAVSYDAPGSEVFS